MSKCRMLECPGTEEQIDSISTRCGVDKIIAKILIGRGLDTAEKAQLFLDQNHRLFHDPFLLPDMERAVVRLQQAIACGELILVVGDSDADGITATAIMMQYLRARAANAGIHHSGQRKQPSRIFAAEPCGHAGARRYGWSLRSTSAFRRWSRFPLFRRRGLM